MRREVATALSVLVAATVPVVLTGNALWLVLNPWLVEFQYALPAFPADPQGLEEEVRTELAVTGVHAVRPGGDGISLLREARLPGGSRAFDERELRHMEDVRAVVSATMITWGVALLAGLAAGLALWRSQWPVRRALTAGGILTIVVMGVIGLLMLVSFEAAFTGFHRVFFEGDSWLFSPDSTLLRLYPELFWIVSGALVAGLVILQAAILTIASRRPRRASRG